MTTKLALSLLIISIGFSAAVAQNEYPYELTNAMSEHEWLIRNFEENRLRETPVNKPAKFILLSNGIKMEYVEQGDPNGIPVIFLHGFPDSYHSYDLVLPLMPAKYHVFTLSQRGHGNTDRPEKGYHPKDFAADVVAFMDAQKIKQAVIVGHSMGSIITQQLVLSYPKYVKAVVLIGTFAKLFDKPEMVEFHKVIAALKDPIAYDFIKEFQVSTFYKSIPASFFDTLMNESVKVPSKVWRGVFDELIKVDNAKALTQVKKPVLLMWGNKDAIGTEKDQQTLLAAIPGSRLITYTEIGHGVQWEAPEHFASDLLAFINTLPK